MAEHGDGKAEKFGDVVRRGNSNLEEEGASSATLIVGLTCRERCTVRHVRDRVRFDQLIAFSVEPNFSALPSPGSAKQRSVNAGVKMHRFAGARIHQLMLARRTRARLTQIARCRVRRTNSP